MREAYRDAKKRAEEAVRKANREGKDPYLPVLDEMIRQADIKNEVSLGLLELPLSRIVGNKERGRNNAFACNFMPLFDEGTEFAMKWSSLHDSVIQEGVRDAIKVYEYMNKYYVQEGNKRVSVSTYCDSEYLTCDVTRLIPVESDTKEYQVYTEYLRFYDATGDYNIILTEPGSYEKLADLIGLGLEEKWTEDRRKDLKSAYFRFRKQYKKLFANEDETSVGNAFFLYLTLFPFKTILDDTDDQIGKNIKMSATEIRVQMDFDDVVMLSETPEAAEATSGLKKLFSGKKGYTAAKPLRVGFIYDCSIEDSRWIDSHEAGRLYVDEMTQDNLVTAAYVAKEGEDGVRAALDKAVADKCEVIFTVTEDMLSAAKATAVTHPEVKLLNCSVGQISPSVRCYSGRFYEAAFLTGVLAADTLLREQGSKDRKIGYVKRGRHSTNLNAFATGVSLIDPECKVVVRESGTSDQALVDEFEMFADIEYSAQHGEFTRPGLYKVSDGKKKNIGVPYYAWGKFYVKIVQSVLSGAWDINELTKNTQAANYWFGMNAGVVDVRAPGIPDGTKKLLSMLKNSIANGYDPFDTDENKISVTELLNMSRINENVVK